MEEHKVNLKKTLVRKLFYSVLAHPSNLSSPLLLPSALDYSHHHTCEFSYCHVWMFLKLKCMHNLPQNLHSNLLVPDTVQSGPLQSKKSRFSFLFSLIWQHGSFPWVVPTWKHANYSQYNKAARSFRCLEMESGVAKLKAHMQKEFMSVKWWTSSFMPSTVTKQCSHKIPGPARDSCTLYISFSDVSTYV